MMEHFTQRGVFAADLCNVLVEDLGEGYNERSHVFWIFNQFTPIGIQKT
jgi:hypothetical protein